MAYQPRGVFKGTNATFDVMRHARITKRRLRHEVLISLHVLIGLRAIPGVAQDILVKQGLADGFELDPLIIKECEKWSRYEGDKEPENLGLITAGVLAAADKAVELSRLGNGNGIVDTEHLLYCLLMRDDQATRILHLLGVESDDILKQIRDRIGCDYYY